MWQKFVYCRYTSIMMSSCNNSFSLGYNNHRINNQELRFSLEDVVPGTRSKDDLSSMKVDGELTIYPIYTTSLKSMWFNNTLTFYSFF